MREFGIYPRREVFAATESRNSPARKGRLWWVLVPAGLTAAAALARLAAVGLATWQHYRAPITTGGLARISGPGRSRLTGPPFTLPRRLPGEQAHLGARANIVLLLSRATVPTSRSEIDDRAPVCRAWAPMPRRRTFRDEVADVGKIGL
jgi:hypothetical protein